MRIHLLRSVLISGHEHMAGAFAEVSDGLAQSLVEAGVAEQVKALLSPPNTQARLRPPRTKTRSSNA